MPPLLLQGPAYEVELQPYAIETTEVTAEAFAEFAVATGYQTDAERFGWSFVFVAQLPAEVESGITRAVQGAEWWLPVDGASWRAPEGPGSSWEDRRRHPATHLSWNDAAAFCAWAGRRLPTEAEWEHAARGNKTGRIFPWGDRGDAEHLAKRANIFEGHFPDAPANPPPDGYLYTAPVASYKANAYGLHDMVGNVWEWTSTDFADRGPHAPPAHAVRAAEAAGEPRYAQKGGSYMCHASYCYRYRVAARTANTADSSSANNGARCAADVTK